METILKLKLYFSYLGNADVNANDSTLMTPLMLATMNEHKEVNCHTSYSLHARYVRMYLSLWIYGCHMIVIWWSNQH